MANQYLDQIDPWPLAVPLPSQTLYLVSVDGREYRIEQGQLPAGTSAGSGGAAVQKTRTQMLALQAANNGLGGFQPGTLYIITGRTSGQRPVAVQAVSAYQLSTLGVRLEESGAVLPCVYLLSSDADSTLDTYIVAAVLAASGRGINELTLPQNVQQGKWYLQPDGIWEASRTMEAQAQPAPGPNWRQVVLFSSYSDPQAVAAVDNATTYRAARLLRQYTGASNYNGVQTAITAANAGDSVEVLAGQFGYISLKNAVPVLLNGLRASGVFTDAGQSISTEVKGGSAVSDNGIQLNVSGPNTNLQVESALYAGPSSPTTVTQSGGVVEHRGLLIGFGGTQTMLNISGGTFRHLEGSVNVAGSYGIVASGTANILIRTALPIRFGYRYLCNLSGSAMVTLEGGATWDVGAVAYATSYLFDMTGTSTLHLRGGVYDTTAPAPGSYDLPAGTVGAGCTLHIYHDATVVKPIVGTGTVHVYGTGKCLGGFADTLTVVYHDQAGEGGGTSPDLSNYYNKAQADARFAKAVAVQPGTVLTFTQDAEYALISSGTFTVDTTGAKAGAVVRVRLGADAAAPALPSGFTKLTSATHTAGKVNLYSFCVAADSTIDYYITVLP